MINYKNLSELQQVLKLIKKTAQSPELKTDEGRELVEIISRYTQTFVWLQRYYEYAVFRGLVKSIVIKSHIKNHVAQAAIYI
ncbi:hypothetical protein [uncultured Psychrobacter sp.]|uniref:hypothetical protein n=1 Tax=uncultured Psychrobacter sp. TaxID=259303 RepID=UPI00260189F9|nr:hypothetical protein [uncultured Psychrobacter sp.]